MFKQGTGFFITLYVIWSRVEQFSKPSHFTGSFDGRFVQ